MKKILLILNIVISAQSIGQSSSNNNNYLSTKYLGFDGSSGAAPLLIKTNNITRLHLNGATTGIK